MFASRSDEAHIERLRRTLATFERWRRPLIVLYLVLAIAFVGLMIATAVFFDDVGRNFGNNAVGMGPGFFVGAGVGAVLGLTTIHIGYQLMDLLLGFRNERLLIRYYEASREPSHETSGADDIP